MKSLHQIQKNPAVIVIIIVAIVSIVAVIITGGKPASVVNSGTGTGHSTIGGSNTIPDPTHGF